MYTATLRSPAHSIVARPPLIVARPPLIVARPPLIVARPPLILTYCWDEVKVESWSANINLIHRTRLMQRLKVVLLYISALVIKPFSHTRIVALSNSPKYTITNNIYRYRNLHRRLRQYFNSF